MCHVWAALEAHHVVRAAQAVSHMLRPPRPSAVRMDTLVDMSIHLSRAYERLACELFLKSPAEGREAASAVATELTDTPLEQPAAGLADLVQGIDRVPAAHARFLRDQDSPSKLGPAPASVFGVLEVLASAACLPAGWCRDKARRKEAKSALATCVAYLETWKKGDLRPVAAALAVSFAEVLEVKPSKHIDLTGLPPGLRALTAGRLMALTRIACDHIAAGKPDVPLRPDPPY